MLRQIEWGVQNGYITKNGIGILQNTNGVIYLVRTQNCPKN